MPTYSIEGPDGKTYSIDGPAGATREQVIAKIKERQAQPERGAVDKLFGLTGERYQTWPERAIRGAVGGFETGAELTKKAMTGEFGPTGGGIVEEVSTGKPLQAATLGLAAAPGAVAELGTAAAGKTFATAKALPSKETIKSSATAAYKAIQDARLTVTPESVLNFSEEMKYALDKKLISDVSAPRSFQAIKQLEKSNGNLANIMDVYSELGGIAPSEGTDWAAAQTIRDGINSYIKNLPDFEVVSGDPKFTQAMAEHARASWRSFAELEQIDSALKVGQHRAAVSGTGANTQNAIRQRIREIVDSESKSRGYSDEAKKQMEDIVTGTWLTNWSRYLGKFAPSGPVSAMTTMGAAIAGDLTGGRGVATAAAASVAIPATIAKYLGTYLTKRQVAELENIIRAESPLGKAAVARVEAQPAGLLSDVLRAGTPALIPGAGSALVSPGQ
jgi:hypothetical protein